MSEGCETPNSERHWPTEQIQRQNLPNPSHRCYGNKPGIPPGKHILMMTLHDVEKYEQALHDTRENDSVGDLSWDFPFRIFAYNDAV